MVSGDASGAGTRAGGGRGGEDPGEGDAEAEARSAGCGAHPEFAGEGGFSEELAATGRRAGRAGIHRASAPVGGVADAGAERPAGDGARLRSAASGAAVEQGGPGRTAKDSFKRRDGKAAVGPAATGAAAQHLDQRTRSAHRGGSGAT